MERLHYPIPLNPNAKYLPNSISNVLYSIQKFDQSTLAWPTCQRKTNVSIGKAFTSPPEVPFAGTATCVIQKGRQCASRCNAKEVQKNTFYQILQASQDQPRIQLSSRIKRKSLDPKSKCDFKDDSIYNDIYDIVRSHTQYKKLPQIEKQPEQQKPISLNPPAVEVYKVRPFANEIKEPSSKTPKSNAKGNKLREKTNELSDSKRITHQSKPKLGESKSSRKHTFKLREKTNELLGSKRTTHHSKPKLAESKSSRKNTNKLREKANELSDSKRTTHHSKPKLAESKNSRKNRNKLQEKTNEITDSRRTSTSMSLQNQLLKFQTRENKQKRNSKSEKHKTTQQLWPIRDKGAVRIPQRSIYNEQSNVGSEIKSNFSTTQLPDPDGQKVQEISTEEQGNLEEKPEQETERASDIKRNSNEESGRRRRKSKLKLKLFNANNNNTIYVVQARNSKGFTRESLSNKRSGKEIYKIQEMKLNPFKEQEEISTLNPQKSDSYILGRSKTRINPNRTRESRASKKISTIREKSLVENISDITIPNNLQTNLKSMSVKPKEQEVNGITAPVKEEIVSKPRKVYPLNSILNVGNISKTMSNPGDQNEKMVQISSQKNKPKDSFEENTAHTTQSTTDKLKSKTKTTSNVSQIKDKSRFFRHKLEPPTPTNSYETEIEALPVYPYEEHDNEDETSYMSESFYLSDRRTVERKSILDRLNLKIRKTNLDMTPEMYQERLIKVKQFLSRHSITENTDTSSIDIEGIPDSDLLMYPYSEIYENRTTVTKVNQPNVSEAIKEDSKPIPRPPDDTRKIQNEKPVCKKTACIICRTIRGNHGPKEAPFMEQMRRENRRRELLAYRAKIEEPRIKSFNILPKDPMNEAKAINLHDLRKKELYTLKSRSNIFGTASSMSRFPKKRNLCTFPSEN